MALDLFNSNPSLWGGQGTFIDNNGGQSTPEDAPDSFWDWWSDNGDSATSAANALLCAINPRRYGCNPAQNESGSYNQNRQDNTLIYVAFGIIVVLILLLFFK